MLDDLFQDQTDAVLDDMVSRPPPVRPAAKKGSVWSTLTAVPRAVATAAAETGAAVAEVVKGYGQVSAATDPMIGVMATRDTRDKLVQGQEQARRDMLERGVEVNSQASDSLRAAARYWMPDPQTAGVAEQTVFGLVRFGAKAVAAAGAGPAAGPVLLGTDEGLAAAEGLRDQGVDLGTRTKVGAVAGATAGASVVLPVAAPGSLAKTVGLWAVGGPGGFMAQQQATRSILERAGYDDLAASYDPLDPVGLAVSSLIPAGFAAWAMRGARAGRAAPKEPAAAGVEAVAERSPAERAPAEPVAESAPAAEPPRATLDEVDAARVELLQQHVEATRPAAPDDVRAAQQHTEALGRAMEQMAAGERVEVAGAADPAGRFQEVMQAFRDRTVNTARGVSQAALDAAVAVRDFVAGPARNPRDNSSKVNFAEVSEQAREKILAATGIDIDAGARQEMRADAARHVMKRHPDLTPEDWAVLPWLAENFDQVVALKTKPSDKGPRLAVAATDPATGYAYVAEYSAGKKKGERLSLVTFFRDHPNAVENYLATNGRKGNDGGGAGKDTPDAPVLPNGPEALTSETTSGGSSRIAPGDSAGQAHRNFKRSGL